MCSRQSELALSLKEVADELKQQKSENDQLRERLVVYEQSYHQPRATSS